MIFMKTELGQTALHNRSVALTPRQRAAFIMFDGKRSQEEVLKATSGLGVTSYDVAHLVSLELLVSTKVGRALDDSRPASPLAATATPGTLPMPLPPSAPQIEAVLSHNADGLPTQSAQAHYSRAYPVATRLTAGLGLRGFRLNLAVEAAGDLDKLKELAPRIREAIGSQKFLELENALYY